PDIRLPQPRLGERRAHARRLPGGVPGAVLAQVVGVRTVAHDGEPAAPRRRDEPAPQLRLAEEATVRRIREIVGILELVRVELDEDRKSTRLNSSHQIISYAVVCLKKKIAGHQPLASALSQQ